MAASEIAIRRAEVADGATVGRLVHELLVELFPESRGDFDAGALSEAAGRLMADGLVWSFLAETGDGRAVGVLTLNECAAIYAKGRFGEICELYVQPAHRSAKVGALLIDAAVAFGRARNWPALEVGAPDAPRWGRTLDFYRDYGFTEVGPRLDLQL